MSADLINRADPEASFGNRLGQGSFVTETSGAQRNGFFYETDPKRRNADDPFGVFVDGTTGGVRFIQEREIPEFLSSVEIRKEPPAY